MSAPTVEAPTTVVGASCVVVWMYQHPSNRNTYKKYSQDHTFQLERAWVDWKSGGPNWVEIYIPDDKNPGSQLAACVYFKAPMMQLSPANEIRRHVARFMQEV